MTKQVAGVQRPFAVFDIDGTLIRWQLYHVMVDKLAASGALGPEAKQQLREARMTWKRREHEESFKQYERLMVRLYESALQTLKTSAFDTFIAEIIDEYKDQTYVYTRDLLKDLKKKDYVTLIISGSHHELIEQVGKYYGFDDWLGSQYVRSGESFSGEKHIVSKDKATALKQLIKKHGLSLESSLAIGDSASDIAMLELVERPIAFNPDKILFEKARQNGWLVVVERKNMIYELKAKDGTYVLD
jgi:HAD superfamily hydrolase (TIGR01490 family)